MGTYPPPGGGPWPGPGGVGRRIEEAIELIEMEVRSESISALRNVANSLRNFADRLDKQQGPPGPPPPQSPRG
jgi:hypothetical protein